MMKACVFSGFIALFVCCIEIMSLGIRNCIDTPRFKSPLTLKMDSGNPKGFGGSKIPKPNIISPKFGNNPAVEKFMMMYTCKICSHRNAQMVSKVAYENGMVLSTCKNCKNIHLIADNEKKLDMPEYGPKIEDYLTAQGEKVQKLSVTLDELDKNYLVDKDGVLTMVPKEAGQPPTDVNIVEYPNKDGAAAGGTSDS